MEIAIYQILTPILSVIMITRAVSHWQRGERTIRELIAILFFWGIISAVALCPDFFVSNFEKITGFKSGITGILFLSVLVLGFLVLHLLRENEIRAHEINEIVSKIALDEEKKKL